MARQIPLLFCRYQLTVNDEALVSAQDQFEILENLQGKMFAHRKADPTPDERDTFLLLPRKKQVETETLLTWEVGKHISQREKDSYDQANEQIVRTIEETDELDHTKFFALPRHGVMAIDDRISKAGLGGKQAASRFKTIFAGIRGGKARIELAGRNADLQRAIDTWDLTNFSFTVRPFNPTVRKPGQMMHEMMEREDIAKIRGEALPTMGGSMHAADEGFISETTGLANAGYGQVGASGVTPEGRRATYSKPKFDDQKDKNLQRQSEPRMLKVYIDEQGTIEQEETEVVRALLEFYARD